MFVVLLLLVPANSLAPRVTLNPEMCCRLIGDSLELDAIMRKSREVKQEENDEVE